MVYLTIPAHVACDEKDCTVSGPAALSLLVTGGFAFRPVNEGWQITAGQHGAFITFCPDHKKRIQVGPAGRRIVEAPR